MVLHAYELIGPDGKPRRMYRAGMYGGKFLPYHRGHLYCLETAAMLCDKVWQILMTGCLEEEQILRSIPREEAEKLEVRHRLARMERAAERFGNVHTFALDISACRTAFGQEDWDAETPLILNRCGRFDAVFGSELSYAAYFKRAYPWADYILVDPPREHYPVSGTAIRTGKVDGNVWMV